MLSDIPESLWKDHKLELPSELKEALREELVARNLYAEACASDSCEGKVYGGQGQLDAVKHFVHRFKTSAARVQYVLTDPNGVFKPHSTALRAVMLDGKVGILDLACGSGGGLAGFLTTLAELRTRTFAPPLPLEVGILGGDFSPEAISIHRKILSQVQPGLQRSGIRIKCEYMHWDAKSPLTTTALMNKWFEMCPSCEEYLVFISAFSDFAIRNINETKEVLRDIGKRLHGMPFLIAWIEPDDSRSQSTLQKVWDSITKLFGVFGEKAWADLGEQFSYVHPFTGEVLRGRARLLPWRTEE